MVIANNSIRLREIQQRIIEDDTTFQNIHNVSISVLGRVLARNRIRMKQIYRVPFERNSEHVKQLRYDYVQRVMELEADVMGHEQFFVDEAGFNLTKTRRCGRNIIGHRAIINVPGQRGDRCVSPALQVKAPQLVLEKERVNLTCETTCSLTDGFIWYKNGQALKIQSETLQLQSERSDSGRYSCAVRGHQHLPSPAVNITVILPCCFTSRSPKSVSVSISPSGEIVEGDSVTLSCSSDSNPPALIFSWFKENQTSAVGSGQSFIISSFNSSHSGRYYCEAQNQHGSQRSASVSVSVKVVGHLVILYIFIGVICGAAVGIVIFLIWRSRWMKKRNDSMESQRNHPRPHHDRHKACDVTEPVYENVTITHPRPHHDRHKACDVTEPVYDNITMNHPRPHHDRHNACDVTEPVYENVTLDGKRL
ncbi:Fc receptor-like protein 1 [Onychostoma macrolepis]|uniref:Fc receptor-like protein 1 n=1 Tax=Onychostoma macrolepis TaxID=369639 RepID=UPI00272DAE25|nr:Fc receptor-like protein 1 [Onychostoma macrolepis]